MFYVVTDTDNMDKNNSVERQKKDKESYNDTFFFDSNNNVQEKKDISRESLSNEKAGNVNKSNNENKAVSSSVILKDEYKSADNIKLSKSDSLLYKKYITDGQKCEQNNQYGCAIDNYKKAYLIKNDENVSVFFIFFKFLFLFVTAPLSFGVQLKYLLFLSVAAPSSLRMHPRLSD